MNEYFHSVTLDAEKCKGCTSCITRCPTEAIRVRKGKAKITTERCIDCGVCIRVCPSHAKQALSDSLDALKQFGYRVAIPAPSLYGQFKDDISIDTILTALKRVGFDDVYEVAEAADIVSEATRRLIEGGTAPRPLISSSCPAVVRLIQVRFPNLIEHLVRIESPMEVAARIVKQHIHKDKKDLGVFFISPCPAKVTSVRSPLGSGASAVDGVIAARDMYLPLLNQIGKIETPERLSHASGKGIGWANSDGESDSIGIRKTISVDEIHQVIDVLEQVENGGLKDTVFIEAMACPGGCVGGPLNRENPYIAKARVKRLIDDKEGQPADTERLTNPDKELIEWEKDIIARPIMKLDEDISIAIKKMEELESISASLPGLDCGSCGAPSCRALAEDIVRGYADKTDCIFILREHIRHLTLEMVKLEEKLPPSLDKEENT